MLNRALFWAMVPLVMPQAARLRRNVPKFIAAHGPMVGCFGEQYSAQPLRIMLLGDSIVAGVGAHTTDNALGASIARPLSTLLERRVHWQSHGVIGARTKKIGGELLAGVPHDSVDAIIISAGVNDVTGLTRSTGWQRDLTRLLDQLETRFPHALIVLASIPPMHGFPLLPFPLNRTLALRARTFNTLSQRLVTLRRRVLWLPLDFNLTPQMFSSDGFHPSQDTYRQLGEFIAQSLAQRLRVV